MSGGPNPDQAEYNDNISVEPIIEHRKFNNHQTREPPADLDEDDTKNLTDEYKSDVNNYLPSYEETCVSNQPCIPTNSNSCSTSNDVPKNFDSLNQHLSSFESTLEVVSNNEEGFKESCLYKSSVQYSEMNIIPQEPEQSLTAEPVLNIRGVSHQIILFLDYGLYIFPFLY